MTPQEFQDLVDRLGEDIREWPRSAVGQARRLIAASDEAQDILEQAERLRRALTDMDPKAPCLFTEKVVAVAMAMDPPDENGAGILN